MFVSRKKIFIQNLFQYSPDEKISFIVLVTQINITLKTCWFNTPEIFTKDCFYKTAIASNLEFSSRRESIFTNFPPVQTESRK